MRRYFLRRVGLFVASFFVLVFVASALSAALFSSGFEPGERRGHFFLPAIFGLILLFIGFVVVARAVRRMATPVADVMEAADRVAGGDYTARVEARGPREMRRLARSFNQMTERLSSIEQQRRNLLADVAHELRTPLSVMRGNLEGVLDGLYPADEAHLGPVVDETAVMSRLLDDLQMLSTADAGVLQLHRESVEPATLIEDATGAFRARASDARISLEGRAAPGLSTIDVDPVRIGEVLANLVSNAVRHTPPGGSVSVLAEPSGGSVVFSVTDTGPGIPPEDLPHVFDRFVKSADSGGAGLGLAIARSLVEAHGGEISAESDHEYGTTIRFALPNRLVPG
ncbi:MAG: sensor histidine kinase [Actinomycetota bacterium]